ncbi:hypothetical protein LIER_29228 [Lithospermum erythrorhizon]|uniref:DUF4371 domain-containing protein n=1 Tax=Lithospermum erythrorhizon TaxID=34254 RepID=A0AAV3RK41_LITER
MLRYFDPRDRFIASSSTTSEVPSSNDIPPNIEPSLQSPNVTFKKGGHLESDPYKRTQILDYHQNDQDEGIEHSYTKYCAKLEQDYLIRLKASLEAVKFLVKCELAFMLVDEFGDTFTKEQMAVVIRFIDEKGFVVERFIGIVHVPNTIVSSCGNLEITVPDMDARMLLIMSCLANPWLNDCLITYVEKEVYIIKHFQAMSKRRMQLPS